MAGNDHLVPRYFKNSDLFRKYQCPQCTNLLKNTVQLHCGHWLCKSCAELLDLDSSPKCPKCQELGCHEDLSLKYSPDYYVREEIEKLEVTCPHREKGCTWEGKLLNMGSHHCEFQRSPSNRGETIAYKVQKCPLAVYGCSTKMMGMKDLRKHIQEKSLLHLQIFAQHLLPVLSSIIGNLSRGNLKNPSLFSCYQCPHCSLLLKRAVQLLICGHFLCENCADKLYASCSLKCPRQDCHALYLKEYGKKAKYSPAPNIRWEVDSLVVFCTFRQKGCTWEDKVINFEEHLKSCLFAEHLMACPLAGVGCSSTQTMKLEELEKHIETQEVEHLQIISGCLSTVVQSTTDDSYVTNQHDCHEEYTKPKENTKPFYGVVNEGGESVINFDEDLLAPQPASTNHPRHPHDIVRKHALSIVFESDVSMESATQNISKSKLEQRCIKKEILRHQVVSMQESVRSRSEKVEPHNQRLRSEGGNYDGTISWEIKDIKLKLADARSGKYPSIFSLPFYSGQHGYKMCLKLYFMGDGIGKNTHMSLFLVIMKGEFDNILPWPFTSKVTFKLINQTGNSDIIDTFQPDPTSSSFQKPKSDMNIVSGCPQFATNSKVINDGFIFTDAVFIECIVDKSEDIKM